MTIAVISDIHSNLEALTNVLKDIDRRRADEIICAGDLVGYGPNPNEVVEIIRKRNILTVRGNHDHHIDLKGLGWFNTYASRALEWTAKSLKEENKEFLLKLPLQMELEREDKKILLVHGSLDNPLYDYLSPQAREDTLNRTLEGEKTDILIVGHSHFPFIRKVKSGEGLVLNPGSVGQPRDGNPKASYSILRPGRREAEIVRLKYDVGTCAGKIRGSGLPEFLAERLFSGK